MNSGGGKGMYRLPDHAATMKKSEAFKSFDIQRMTPEQIIREFAR